MFFCFILCLVLFQFSFLGPLNSVLSYLLWNSLWLVEEMLTLLCFFLIVRMEISQFLGGILLKVSTIESM
jgi:hypothetical protein